MPLYHCRLQIGTCHRCWPSTSIRIKSGTAATADFQNPLKGVWGDSRNETLFRKKTGRTGVQIAISRADLMSPMLVSLHI